MTQTTSRTGCGCGCGDTHGVEPVDRPLVGDLPSNPFESLRATYGMLLGEPDFRVLAGHPRGKLMLHNAWLHGRGVVWGMAVTAAGDELRVHPGLALDGWGRELRLTSRWCLSVQAWAQRWLDEQESVVDCETRTVHAWVVAEPDACLGRPVPALADPCDVDRKHDEWSRVVETTRIVVLPDPPASVGSYHRVRVLLGLDDVGADDEEGRQAMAARREVLEVSWDQRPARLLHWLRRLAACDEMDLAPLAEDGEECVPLAPLPEAEAGVLLARLEVTLTARGGCASVVEVCLDPHVRTALLPTSVIQELACGLAPALLGPDGPDAGVDAGGPRLVEGSAGWADRNTRFSFRVTVPLAAGSEEGVIQVSSLADDGRGWATDKVERVVIDDDGRTVHCYLDREPKYETVRVLIRGTGRRALYGDRPRVPFAGVHDGPPGTEHDGHDAVVTTRPGRLVPRSRRTTTERTDR